MKTHSKLDQLTALRFFAALMIVLHHLVGVFGIKDIGVNWGQSINSSLKNWMKRVKSILRLVL
jgi:peptidoglycan/LPS O-acetylase OafA/YrhL